MATRVDLRSDTVTQPTRAMRDAMAEAPVGDDYYREDPTVRALEEECAEMLGCEAALFTPSGTMANQIAIHLLVRPGDEVLIEATGHSYDWEYSGMAVISGAQPRPIVGDCGVLPAGRVKSEITERPAGRAAVRLVIVENTHNMAGGRVWPSEATLEVQNVCRDSEIPVHLDGARLFNAAVASGASVTDLAAGFDTVMVSLSKGLCAPGGSLLAGPHALMAEARRIRQLLGGGMRQAGILAAAGRVALASMIDRLAADHAKARRLADGLIETGKISLAFGHVDTNVVVVDVDTTGLGAAEFCQAMGERGVLCGFTAPGQVRLVTHRDVTEEGIDVAIRAARAVVAGT